MVFSEANSALVINIVCLQSVSLIFEVFVSSDDMTQVPVDMNSGDTTSGRLDRLLSWLTYSLRPKELKLKSNYWTSAHCIVLYGDLVLVFLSI